MAAQDRLCRRATGELRHSLLIGEGWGGGETDEFPSAYSPPTEGGKILEKEVLTMAFKHIQTEMKDGVAYLTLNRAPLNWLNIEMMQEFNTYLESLMKEKEYLTKTLKNGCLNGLQNRE